MVCKKAFPKMSKENRNAFGRRFYSHKGLSYVQKKICYILQYLGTRLPFRYLTAWMSNHKFFFNKEHSLWTIKKIKNLMIIFRTLLLLKKFKRFLLEIFFQICSILLSLTFIRSKARLYSTTKTKKRWLKKMKVLLAKRQGKINFKKHQIGLKAVKKAYSQVTRKQHTLNAFYRPEMPLRMKKQTHLRRRLIILLFFFSLRWLSFKNRYFFLGKKFFPLDYFSASFIVYYNFKFS